MAAPSSPPYFLADLYSFDWSEFSFRLPLISAGAVAICLFVGIFAGHPGAGLIAGGGAFTVGFGANQRISDSRLIPMIAAVLATSAATLMGALVGHHSGLLVLAASVSGLIYGVLTARNTGVSWVAQQAIITLLVSSAFPIAPEPAFVRAGLLAAGGTLQLLITSAGLRLIPNLRNDLLSFASFFTRPVSESDPELTQNLCLPGLRSPGFRSQDWRQIYQALPCLSRSATIAYSLRLCLTMFLATELYRHAGIQSGYWIPMTALLVQKPALFETFTRAFLRIAGTLSGAWICSLIIAELSPGPLTLAGMATLFALLAYATNTVNYGLFSACVTAHIVFLLSLNQIPGTVIAHRRAWCTIAGGLIAIVIHADALRRLRRASTQNDAIPEVSGTS